MTIKTILLCLAVGACGGGSKKAEEPKPPTTEQAVAQPEAPPATVPAEKQEPAEPAPPPGPKFVLGEAKIVMKADMGKGEKVTSEITIAADGALKAVMKSTNKKKPTKTNTGKLTADGELLDDKNEVVAKLGDDGTMTARQTIEDKQNGKVVKTETKMEAVGTLADDGVFTSSKDSAKFSIDDKGKIAGLPADFTVTAKPEHKKAVMFVVIAMFAASKMTVDSSASSAPAGAPAPVKK